MSKSANDRLWLMLVGKVSAGKSTLVNALLKQPVATVSPISGTTEELSFHKLNDWFEVVDSPGLEDVRPEVEEKTREALGHADVVLFCVNCGEGATENNKTEIERIQKAGCPLRVIFTRSDLIRDEDEREQFAIKTAAQLNASDCSQLLSVETGEGVQELSGWIQGLDGRSLDWARMLKYGLPHLQEEITKEANETILNHSIIAAATGGIPIPLADMPLITTCQVNMAYKLAKIYGHPIDAKRIKELVGVLAGAFLGREAARQLVKLIPFVGSAISASVAFGATWGLGMALREHFAQNLQLKKEDEERLRRLARREANTARKRFRADKALQTEVAATKRAKRK